MPGRHAGARYDFRIDCTGPPGRGPDVTDDEATYAVYGGQGLRRIASGLYRADAERVSRKFEIDCMNAGLINPPGRIEREL